MENVQIIERLAVVERITEDLYHRLFGNGNQGDISDLDKRIQYLEKRANRLMGFISAVVLFMEFSHHVDWLFKIFHG